MNAELDLEVYEVTAWKVWPYFAPHHYMSETLNKAARGWVAVTKDGQPVAFSAALPMPSGTVKNAWRESRTVVLPDFQGLGLGARMSEWVGELILWDKFGAYYSRTVHPRLGEYRERSPAWVATSSNRKKAGPMGGKFKIDMETTLSRRGEEDNQYRGEDGKLVGWVPIERVAYSHRYIGYPEVKCQAA